MKSTGVWSELVITKTLPAVARLSKHKPALCSARSATLCRVDESWKDLRHAWERLRWARLHRTKFDRPTDAARSLNIKPVTYRTYEIDKADGGRSPPLSELQRIADKFGVSWIWLVAGQGSPDFDPRFEATLNIFSQKASDIPTEKRDDAISAAMGVLDAFTRKAG